MNGFLGIGLVRIVERVELQGAQDR